MQNKILYIVGTTSTGKTELALELARKFNGDLISADSRQVYKGMDIGTGKDLPGNFKIKSFDSAQEKINYYTDGQIRIWGLDLVEPDEEFSVADYIRDAIPVIEDMHRNNRLPIIVGGTGLYIRALLKPLPYIFIPRNLDLRKKLDQLSILELQQELKRLDSTKFNSMNVSDKKNPRRLVRVIEIEIWKKKQNPKKVTLDMNEMMAPESGFWTSQNDKLILGLTTSKEDLNNRIDQRVETRVKKGILKEIQSLINQGYKWDLPAMSGLGYREWQPYFEASSVKRQALSDRDKLKQDIIRQWKQDEHSYAKRQMTWFKKEPEVMWFDMQKSSSQDNILTVVKKWYNQENV